MLNTLDVQKISPARDKCKERSVATQAICLSHKINWIQHVIAETSAEPRNTYPSPGDTPSLQSKQAKQKCILILTLHRQADTQTMQAKKTITKPLPEVTNRSAIFFLLNKNNLPGIWRQAHYPDTHHLESFTNAFLLMFCRSISGNRSLFINKEQAQKASFSYTADVFHSDL